MGNAEMVRELFRLIDWMMHLRDDLADRLRQQLDDLEESLAMPYVTSVERLAKAEGKAEGAATLITKLLPRFCGPIPENIQQRLHSLSIDQIDALSDAMFAFGSLGDLESWLEANENGRNGEP